MNASAQLALTLCGVMLLFACAQQNETTQATARQVLRLCRGRVAFMPPLFFLLTAVLSSIGPGSILSTAIMAPLAMSIGGRSGIPSLLTALMVANGANAGNLSPVSSIGVIVNSILEQNLPAHDPLRIWFFHALAHTMAAAAAWLLFGGSKLSWQQSVAETNTAQPLQRLQWITLAVLLLWAGAVLFFGVPLGWWGLGAAALLLLMRAAHWRAVLSIVPWKTIALVVGISTAVTAMEAAGWLNWMHTLATLVSSPATIHPFLALLTGLISTYSSTSAVVLPAFLPMAAAIAARMPGVDAFALATSINIGSALVDVSPLSTLGALCVAAAPKAESTRLFRALLYWGWAMSPAAALFCWLLSPLFSG
jgi:di/tricarboxylate transporter